jgi:hypothetical protein
MLSNQDRDLASLVRNDLATSRQETLVKLDWDIEGLAVSPDGEWLAYAVNEDGASRVVLWSLKPGAKVPVEGLPFGIVEGLTWSPRTHRGRLRS